MGTTGDFYQAFAHWYDIIFPPGPRQVGFLAGLVTGLRAQNVLDLACGTGGYVLSVLAAPGRRATGVDLEPIMIEQALAKRAVQIRAGGPEGEAAGWADFRTGDMRDLTGLPDGSFDLVTCLGNSLPHLLEDQDLAAAAAGIHRVLRPGGMAVIQTVGFERALAVLNREGSYDLPLIERPAHGLRFERRYLLRGGCLLTFETKLTTASAGRPGEAPLPLPASSVRVSETTLRPLTAGELSALLEAAGLRVVQVLGSFAGEPKTDTSPATIVCAAKADRA